LLSDRSSVGHGLTKSNRGANRARGDDVNEIGLIRTI
jgi:hypothetical protein